MLGMLVRKFNFVVGWGISGDESRDWGHWRWYSHLGDLDVHDAFDIRDTFLSPSVSKSWSWVLWFSLLACLKAAVTKYQRCITWRKLFKVPKGIGARSRWSANSR